MYMSTTRACAPRVPKLPTWPNIFTFKKNDNGGEADGDNNNDNKQQH